MKTQARKRGWILLDVAILTILVALFLTALNINQTGLIHRTKATQEDLQVLQRAQHAMDATRAYETVDDPDITIIILPYMMGLESVEVQLHREGQDPYVLRSLRKVRP